MWLVIALVAIKWTVLVLGYRALMAAFDATDPDPTTPPGVSP